MPADGADVLELDAGFTDGASRHLLEQIESLVHEDFGPLLPAMLLLVPLGGLARVARLDPGVAEESFVVGKAGEQTPGAQSRLRLWKRMPRHRGGDARNLDIEVRLQATGSAKRAPCLQHHVFPGGRALQVGSLDPRTTREPAVARRRDVNSSCGFGNAGKIAAIARHLASPQMPQSSLPGSNRACRCGL
jgi:hypothetical protein